MWLVSNFIGPRDRKKISKISASADKKNSGGDSSAACTRRRRRRTHRTRVTARRAVAGIGDNTARQSPAGCRPGALPVPEARDERPAEHGAGVVEVAEETEARQRVQALAALGEAGLSAGEAEQEEADWERVIAGGVSRAVAPGSAARSGWERRKGLFLF
jgi:hypothetical protein